MEFEAKLTFNVEALPEAIRQEYLHELVRLEDQSDPVVIDGLEIHRTKAIDDLETISLKKLRGEEVSSDLYIIMYSLHGNEPQWLRAIHPVKINIGPIELEEDLGMIMKVGPGPHGAGTEIIMIVDDWNKVKPLMGTFVLINKSQICTCCGSTIVAPSGTIIVDPRITACPSVCS